MKSRRKPNSSGRCRRHLLYRRVRGLPPMSRAVWVTYARGMRSFARATSLDASLSEVQVTESSALLWSSGVRVRVSHPFPSNAWSSWSICGLDRVTRPPRDRGIATWLREVWSAWKECFRSSVVACVVPWQIPAGSRGLRASVHLHSLIVAHRERRTRFATTDRSRATLELVRGMWTERARGFNSVRGRRYSLLVRTENGATHGVTVWFGVDFSSSLVIDH